MSIVPRASFSDDSRIIKKPLPRSLLLRDYLLDDMSSCSSNGFRSYPRRRQCCTTFRFLLEMDLNKHTKLPQKQLFLENKNKSKSKHEQSSILQRASAVMIKAFKHFPFSGLWKKTNRPNKDVKLLKSFGDLIKETPGFSTVDTTMADLNNSASNSHSCSGSEFTATTNSFTTGNSMDINLAQNEVADELPENKRVGTTTSTATANNYSDNTENAKDEQFSPVSVMDFPCDNVKDDDHEDDDGVSSMFQDSHLDVEETKKVMHKTRRFESVSQLEPVKLEDRIAQSALESSMETCYQFSQEENQAEKKTMALLQLIKSAVSCHHFLKYEALEHLLLGFFKEKTIDENISDYEMLQTAKDWVDGQVQVMFLDWESQKNRQTYVQEMEKAVKWSKYSDEVEKENVVLELEYELFNSLVDDILYEFHL